MINKIYFVGLLLLTSCGPLIEPGYYEVETTYTKDTWPGSKEGETNTYTWELKEDEGQYTVSVVNSSNEFSGQEEGSKVEFYEETTYDESCSAKSYLSVVLKPTSKGFKGTGETYFKGTCEWEPLFTEAEFVGDKSD